MKDKNTPLYVRRWTREAVRCYLRGCRCVGCFYREFFANKPYKCQMKKFVIESVRVLGVPPDWLIKEVNKSDEEQ